MRSKLKIKHMYKILLRKPDATTWKTKRAWQENVNSDLNKKGVGELD